MLKSDPSLEDEESLEAQLPRLAVEGKLESAAKEAIDRQWAKGMAVTFLRDERIIARYPDGHEEIIATLVRPADWTPRHTTRSE